eukprot:152397-Chlamydomonas_euryale.AAC.1
MQVLTHLAGWNLKHQTSWAWTLPRTLSQSQCKQSKGPAFGKQDLSAPLKCLVGNDPPNFGIPNFRLSTRGPWEGPLTLQRHRSRQPHCAMHARWAP